MKKPVFSLPAASSIRRLLGCAAVLTPLPAGAVTIVSYGFGDTYAHHNELPSGILSAGDITFGAGLTEPISPAGTGISTNPDNTLYVRSTVVHGADIATAIGADDYFSFEVAIAAGFALNLHSVSISQWTATADYASNLAVYYTLNGTDFSSEAVAVKLGENTTNSTTAGSHSFSGNLADDEALTGTVRFHFVVWDAANTNLPNRVGRFDDINVDGIVTEVPEPVTFTLLLPVILLSALSRRR